MTRAEQDAEDLVFDFGLTLPIIPKDVCAAISEPDFHFEYVEEAMQTGNFHGMSRATDSGAVIIVNQKIENAGRKVFTGAHEIGHAVMHIQTGKKNHFECSKTDISGKGKVNFEKEANEFASSLIMPKALIGDMINQNELSWKLIHSIKSCCETSLLASAMRVVSLSENVCALIVHKDGDMWTPTKSKSFNYYIPKRPFSKDLETSPDLPTDSFTDELLECEPADWGIGGNDLPDTILYYSIHNAEYDRTMTLILVPEIEEEDEVSCQPTF